ncbi:MAG: 50S ribosomal protein L1 [Candidatus Omnitrophica bacterium]|nr:50S ribosomal protein L1 [Candidatus Omnitrophota bacterium]
MKKLSKRYRTVRDKIEKGKIYSIEKAVEILKELHSAKFDETVELCLRLGVDTKKTQQPVRGAVVLPHGSGRKVRVLVMAQGEAVEKARQAGADFVGGQELVDKIKSGWLDFDAVVATPDMMKMVAPLGKVLGPRGLMPSPKTGTVTFDVDQITSQLKKGRTEFRMDKDGNVHIPVGKISFSPEKLVENIQAAIRAVEESKPSGSRGQLIRKVFLSLSMSPSVEVAPAKSTVAE